MQVFQTYVANVFLFRTYVASILSECFKSISGCCTCCNVTHPATTTCCSCLGVVYACGGAEGWSAAWQRPPEAEGNGGRGASGSHATCASGKRRGCRRKAEGARAIRIEARSGGAVSKGQQRQTQKRTVATGVTDVRPDARSA